MVISLLESGTACLSILDSKSVRGHPLIARSFLSPAREEDSDDEFGLATESNPLVGIALDRPRDFVIHNSPDMGIGCVRGVKTYGRGQTMQKMVALAVRNHGNHKYANILRLLHAVPSPMDESLQHWVTSHHTWNLSGHLYNYKTPNGPTTIPTSTEGETSIKEDVEFHLAEDMDVLTVAQRCADWFTMREFRLTSTSAAKILLRNSVYRARMGLPQLQNPTEPSEKLLEQLSKSWFGTSRSTEAMMRGTANEDAVPNTLLGRPFIHLIFKVGLLCNKERPWLAASLDAVAVFDINACKPGYSRENQEPDFHIAAVEIKTAVGRQNVASGTMKATPELIVCEMNSDIFRKYVPVEHAAQLVHQIVALNTQWMFYVSTSESQILFTVLTRSRQQTRAAIRTVYDDTITPQLRWAHEDQLGQQPMTGNESVDSLIKSRLRFWRLLRNDIRDRGPFVAVRVFKHASQTLYNKRKGGVNGNAQQRAVLRCSTDSLKWEQKVVTQVLKIITVNAWVAWRQLKREDKLSTTEKFMGLDQYRQALNRVKSFADFIYEVTPELLAYADTLAKDDDVEETRPTARKTGKLRKNELTRLITKAKKRKRYRLEFFNSLDGISLRINMQRHDHNSESEPKYCALCGNNTASQFRGHRTRIICKQCNVHLCVKVRYPFKRSCWDVWHSVQKLKPRQPRAVVERQSDARVPAEDMQLLDDDAQGTHTGANTPTTTPRPKRRTRASLSEPTHA